MSVVTLQKIGSEYVLNIPQELIENLGLQAGSLLEIHADAHKNMVLEPVQAEFSQILDIHEKLMDDYHAAFERLAQ